MNEEIKSAIEAGLAEVKSKVETATKENASQVEAKMTEMQSKLDEASKNGVDKETIAKMQEHLDSLDVKMQKSVGKVESKSFNENLSDAIAEKADEIKSFANSRQKEMKLEMKAVGDMSSANFAGASYANLTTEYRQGILPLADSTVYLRDLLPKGTTQASAITYPRHTGGEGAPAVWESGAKAQIDFDFDAVTSNVQWIAGYLKVPREMLDDVAFLESFLRANLLRELLKVENAQILNGTGVSPNLHGLVPQAQAYNGSYTALLEKIVDAAYGQVMENGHSANAVVLNARDAVGIYLNKASGSGEFDLPGGIGFVNGRLQIAGLNVVAVPTAQMAAGSFLTGDFNAAQLITRLSPEIRFFEQDTDNVQKNMITVRVEERVALPVYYPNAFVKYSIPITTTTTTTTTVV